MKSENPKSEIRNKSEIQDTAIGMPSFITIGCQSGGPEAGAVGRAKVPLYAWTIGSKRAQGSLLKTAIKKSRGWHG